jgi:uncharacterized protein (TIGR02266 family)
VATSDSVRIRLRYADLDTFVEKFAPNVTRGGVFLATRSVRAVGAVVPFEIQLAGGEVALAGEGTVTWVRTFDPAEPSRPHGMGVQFVSVKPATRPVLARILRHKDATGATQRRLSGSLPTLSALGMGSSPSGGIVITNGRLVPGPAVDTGVDLAAEMGIDEDTIRRVIERAWMIRARLDDDVDALLKPDDFPPPTLADAMIELPRLLDPQSSRRRLGTGSFRSLEALAASGEPGSRMVAAALGSASRDPHEDTQQDPGPAVRRD